MHLGNQILLASALVLTGCEGRFPWSTAESPRTPTQDQQAIRLALAPQALVLNVPSSEPCPCPYDATGSFQVSAPAGAALAWSVADRGVARVDEQGVVTAVATGETVVILASGVLKATASLQVVDRGGRAAVEIR